MGGDILLKHSPVVKSNIILSDKSMLICEIVFNIDIQLLMCVLSCCNLGVVGVELSPFVTHLLMCELVRITIGT